MTDVCNLRDNYEISFVTQRPLKISSIRISFLFRLRRRLHVYAIFLASRYVSYTRASNCESTGSRDVGFLSWNPVSIDIDTRDDHVTREKIPRRQKRVSIGGFREMSILVEVVARSATPNTSRNELKTAARRRGITRTSLQQSGGKKSSKGAQGNSEEAEEGAVNCSERCTSRSRYVIYD